MCDPVKGVERPIELPCAVARGTSFCESTQRQLMELHKKEAPFDRFLSVVSLVGAFLAFVASAVLFVFMVVDLAVGDEAGEYAVTVVVCIADVIVAIAAFVPSLALSKHGVETGFLSKDVMWMRQNLGKGGSLIEKPRSKRQFPLVLPLLDRA